MMVNLDIHFRKVSRARGKGKILKGMCQGITQLVLWPGFSSWWVESWDSHPHHDQASRFCFQVLPGFFQLYIVNSSY